MTVSISEEALIFLKTAIGGTVIGMIFDIYRLIKNSGKNLMLLGFGDIIVWLVLSIVSFEVVFIANSGDIRWYEALAMLTGFILYTVSVSKYFTCGVKFIAKIIKKTAHIVFIPFKWLKRAAGFIFMYVKKLFIFVGFWLKLQKKHFEFIKNKQIFDFRRLNRIFRKN